MENIVLVWLEDNFSAVDIQYIEHGGLQMSWIVHGSQEAAPLVKVVTSQMATCMQSWKIYKMCEKMYLRL